MKKSAYYFLTSFLFFSAAVQAQNLPAGMTTVKKVPAKAELKASPMDIKICNSVGIDELRDLALDHRKAFASADIPPEKRGRLPLPPPATLRDIQTKETWAKSLIGMSPVILKADLDVQTVLIINDLQSPNSTMILTDSKGNKTLIHINEPNTIIVPSIKGCRVTASAVAPAVPSEQETTSAMDKAINFLGFKSKNSCSAHASVRMCKCSMPAKSLAHAAQIESQCVDENSVCSCTTRPGHFANQNTFSHLLVSKCGGTEVTTPIMGQTDDRDVPDTL